VIKIAHFQSKRAEANIVPTWTDAEKLLNDALDKDGEHNPRNVVLGISGYPSALHHNLVIVYDDGQPPK